MISYQTSQKTSMSIARARTVVRIVRVFLVKHNRFNRGGVGASLENKDRLMMTFVSRSEDDWIRWPSRELVPTGRCCYSNKCHERTATDLNSNLQTLTMVNH